MLHVRPDSGQECVELGFLRGAELGAGVKNGGHLEVGQRLAGVLLEVFFGEDALDFLVEGVVPHLAAGVAEVGLELREFFLRQHQLLGVEGGPELCGVNNSLSQWVVVLEELAESDSMSLHELLDFVKQLTHVVGASEVSVAREVGRLGAGEWFIDSVLETVAVLDESQILNIPELVAVDAGDRGDLSIVDGDSKEGQDLLELLRRHFEVVVAVVVLEEALCVEAFPDDHVTEGLPKFLDNSLVLTGGNSESVVRNGSSIAEHGVHVFFKALLGEYFIHTVAEIPPHYLSALACCKSFTKLVEFISTKDDLSHVQANSELGVGNEAAPKFVEISEELCNSNPLLLAELSKFGEDVFDIIGDVFLDVVAGDSGFGFGVVVERVVVSSSNSEQVLGAVNIVAEIKVIELVTVAFVAVSFEEQIHG